MRVIVAGIAAAAAWWAGIVVVFGPAQAVLADPQRQSAKFLAAFAEPPLPRMADSPWALPLGLLVIGLIHALAYRWLGSRLSGPAWRRGLAFGLLAWALMVPWFEFYLPWNVMREPWPLVLLETLCWMIVLLFVGVVIAVVHDAGLRGRDIRVEGN
jgi:hypothetical protein